MQRLAMISAIVFCAVTSPLLALGNSVYRDDQGLVLVVASPFGPPVEQIIANSALAEVYPERAPFGAFVTLSGPADAARLRASGAALLLSGERILAICS